jgi:aspartyl-tRNA(Asn)/glutamyl-tRNA(Gln) amidotransferase subunit A
VAARLATSGLGTQTGGSITSPGLAQGLTAFKPTFGRTSLYGVIPLTYTRDHTGPIARDAKDAAIMLQAIAGADPNDPRTIGLPPVPDYISAATPVVRGRRVRMRWPTTVGIFPGFLAVNDPQQVALRQELLAVLARVERLSLVDLTLPDEWDILTGTLASTTGEGTNAFLADMQRDVAQFATRLTGFLAGTLRSASSYLRVLQARYILFERALETFGSQCDLILGGPAGSFDGIGWPLSSFPIGFGTDATTGLTVPRGALIGGLPYGEERMLAFLASYQAMTDWHLRRPPDPTNTAETATRSTNRSSAPDLVIDPAPEPEDEQ